jgi:hypothetical protein
LTKELASEATELQISWTAKEQQGFAFILIKKNVKRAPASKAYYIA